MSDDVPTTREAPDARETREAREATHAPSTWRVELVAVVLLVLVAIPSLAWPAGRDQGIEGVTGLLLTRGWVPYRDVFSNSPPGGFTLYALGFAILGPSPLAVRIIDLCWMALGVWGLTRLGAREAGPVAGLVAGLILALSYFGQGDFWHTAQRDGFMLIPSIWAVVFARREDLYGAVLAGLCVGVAALFKPGGAVMGLPVALAIGWRPRRVLLAAGCACIPPLLFVVALLATGSVEACQAGLVEFNRGYAENYRTHSEGRLAALATTLARLPVFERPELALGVLGLFAPPRTRRVALGWLVAGVASPMAQASLYPYHLLPLVPPLALMAGVGLPAVDERAGSTRPLRAGLAVLALLASVDAMVGVGRHAATSVAIVRGTVSEGDYNEQFAASREYELMAEFMREEGDPGDRLLIWGNDPQPMLMADLLPADRYLVSWALVAPWGEVEDRGPHVERLQASPPRWVMVRSGDRLPWLTGTYDDSATSLTKYPELWSFLRRHYRMVRTTERLLLLRHHGPPA